MPHQPPCFCPKPGLTRGHMVTTALPGKQELPWRSGPVGWDLALDACVPCSDAGLAAPGFPFGFLLVTTMAAAVSAPGLRFLLSDEFWLQPAQPQLLWHSVGKILSRSS